MSDARIEETRQLIIRKAGELFMELGYRAVSTRMVAAACGLTQPALYHHFGGKQDLYMAVLLDELERLRVGLTRIERLSEPGLDRLGQAATFLTQRTDVDHALMAHDIRWELSPERRLHVGSSFRRSLVDPLVGIVGEAVAEGAMRDPLRLGLPVPMIAMHFLNIVRFVITSAGDHAGQGTPVATSLPDRGSLVMNLFLGGMGLPAAEKT